MLTASSLHPLLRPLSYSLTSYRTLSSQSGTPGDLNPSCQSNSTQHNVSTSNHSNPHYYNYPPSSKKPSSKRPFVPLSQGGTELASKSQLTLLGAHKHFKVGDLYTPNDLDEMPMGIRSKSIQGGNESIQLDAFKAMRTDPIKVYKDTTVLSHFVTETGMIMHRKHTKLSAKNQRKLTKVVKRARAMGLMPYTYRMDPHYRPPLTNYLNFDPHLSL